MNGLSFSNLAYLDELYKTYKLNPASLGTPWQNFFSGWEVAESLSKEETSSDLKIYHLIQNYRIYGHLAADINPLMPVSTTPIELDIGYNGFKTEDLDQLFPTCGLFQEKEMPLRTIVEKLKSIYAGSLGIEYMGFRSPELEKWVQERLEAFTFAALSVQEKERILEYLNKAELFEIFLHTKYVGQKRFSLEGAETFIPMLGFILDTAADEGASEIVMGMAHRGRLNVLASIMNKPYDVIFQEFEDSYLPDLSEGTGDVKYHKGYAAYLRVKNNKQMFITLCPNPSHLEAVDPVVEGQARGRQEIKGKKEVIPILVHGDASLAGQGVVYETMQMAALSGYETAGTIHIVINNQIGFTTLAKDGRSTNYCTDIAKAFGAPVLHVNAEKPEECVLAAKLATQIRQTFHCDVFIDLHCYRKYGHNEGDEPVFTQPSQYSLIRHKKSIKEMYKESLVQQNILQANKAELAEVSFKEKLQQTFDKIKTGASTSSQKAKKEILSICETQVAEDVLKELAHTFCTVPEGFSLHPKIKRLLDERCAMMSRGIDWALAEHLAYASLLVQNVPIRLSGQDSGRGTFSQRHAIWTDQDEGDKYYIPLNHLKKGQALLSVYNSLLSEFAALGFEFGYSLSKAHGLTIWEAQYGDFCNAAQVIIDQFMAASHQKWGLTSNLSLFLPHGYEGQGPEHSSGRIERFLQLCAQNNMCAVNCTTPSQLFHLLRRQALQKQKRPLILFTPKALLRHPHCISSLKDLTDAGFEEFLDDTRSHLSPRKILLCSGKVYYDLLTQTPPDDIAIIRIEQLYPFNKEKFKNLLSKYSGFKDVCWVQEEPANMGAFSYMASILQELLSMPIKYIGRERSAATAVGSFRIHQEQLKQILKEALT